MNVTFEDFEAVASLKFGSLDDGAYHKAESICTDYAEVRFLESMAVTDEILENLGVGHAKY